jgi:hypothetical protein
MRAIRCSRQSAGNYGTGFVCVTLCHCQCTGFVCVTLCHCQCAGFVLCDYVIVSVLVLSCVTMSLSVCWFCVCDSMSLSVCWFCVCDYVIVSVLVLCVWLYVTVSVLVLSCVTMSLSVCWFCPAWLTSGLATTSWLSWVWSLITTHPSFPPNCSIEFYKVNRLIQTPQ